MIFRPSGSVGGVDLIRDDFPKRFDAQWGEGEGLSFIDVMDPDNAVFRLELIGQVPQQILFATQDAGRPFDGEDVGDSSQGLRRLGLAVLFPFPWQQFVKTALRRIVDARQHIGEPGLRVNIVQIGRSKQARHGCRPFRPTYRAGEQPGLSPQGKTA